MGYKKYFLAVIIPSPLQEETEQIKAELLQRHGLRGALRSPAHITLHRPFEWKEEKEQELTGKLKTFGAVQPFGIRLRDFAAFEPRVIYVNVVKNETLDRLQSSLKKFAQRELKLFNELNDPRGFHPHVTVASRDLKKNRFEAVWQEYRERSFGGEFTCEGFSLLRLEEKWRELCFFGFQEQGR